MAAIVPVVDSLDKVAEPLRSFYEQKDGKFHLQIDGAGYVSVTDLTTANTKLAEFRDKNITLLKQVAELEPLKTKYADLDVDAARAALKKVADLDKKGIKDVDDIDVKLKTMLEAALKPLKDELQTERQGRIAEGKRADASVLKQTITDSFTKAGGRAKAADYITKTAEDIFEVKDGKVVAKTGVFSKTKVTEPLSVDEWLGQMTKEHDFAFESSSGGGSEGKKGGSSTTDGRKVITDPTPQQLGELGKDIAAGKVRIEHTTQ